MTTHTDDFNLTGYHFELPEALIAQEPPAVRGASRLMVLNRKNGNLVTDMFARLGDYLPPCLFVINNSRVVAARRAGTRASGGKAEFLLLSPLPLLRPEQTGGGWTCEAQGLLRPAKNLRIGDTLRFADDFALTVLEKGEFGRGRVRLEWQGDLAGLLERYGSLPLPPYIRRPATEADAARYQTVYSRKDKAGSVAAPTAGLHFTPELRESLSAAGHQWTEVTLYVGYGTFSPVRAADIRKHVMHEEFVELPPETASAIQAAKAEGRPVVAVGTTAARTLEGAFAATGSIGPYSGFTDIFLYPGRPVRVVDHLLTNFHLPESSLIMLTAAFAGREAILSAYARAVEEKFRFFSYGDAMLIL